VELQFSGELVFWRGPAPWHFVAVPEEESAEIEAVATMVTYGWGCIPVTAAVGETTWRTSLFPKDGRYLVPVKSSIRETAALKLGDTVGLRLSIDSA
jgi:Domain of unknown function (DUF1905)